MFKCICGQVMVVPGTALALKIQKQGTMKGHLCFVQDKSDMYGQCFLRVTSKKIFKKWSERFFSIQDGFILFFRTKLLAAQGATAVHKVQLHRLLLLYQLSGLKCPQFDLPLLKIFFS